MGTYWENWGIGAAVDDHTGAILRVGGQSLQRQLKELYGGRSLQPDATNGHLTGTYCDPRDWTGWDPTGTNDVSSYLQQAFAQSLIDAVPIITPPGIYAIGAPVDYGVNLYDGVQLYARGEYEGFGPSNTTPLGNHATRVRFISTMVDKPVFYNSHPVRGTTFKGIGVFGPNTQGNILQAPNDFKQNYNPSATYRDAQYSPQCAFSIDGFNSTTPSDGGYPGMTAQYGALGGSSGMLFENVNVQGFVVGTTVGCNVGTQADTIFWNNCCAKWCDTAYAVGGGQSKQAMMLFGLIIACRQAFDGANYGAKQGWPIVPIGTCYQYLHRIFNYQDTFGPLIAQMGYIESVRSFGNFGTGFASQRGHCTIQGGQFTMDNSSSLPPPLVFETYGIASIRDMNINGAAGVNPLAYNFGNDILSPIKLDTVQFGGQAGGVPGIVGMTSAGSVVELDNCLMNSGSPVPWSDNSAVDVGSIGSNKRFIGTVRSRNYRNGTATTEYIPASTSGTLNVAATGTTIDSRSVTFVGTLAIGATSGTISSAWTDKTGWYFTTFPNTDVRPVLYTNGSTAANWGQWGTSSAMTAPTATALGVTLTSTITDITLVQSGDIFFWKMVKQDTNFTQRTVCAWVVTNIAGSVITCQPICDATFYDTVANNGGGTTLVLHQFQWAPAQNFTCTTNGTANLSAVLPINLAKAGDWVTGTGFATNTRVISTDGAGNVVLNKTVTGSGTLIPMHFGQFVTRTTNPTWT